MPAFLVLSGYLLNVKNTFAECLRSLRAIVFPFVIFEVVYVVALGTLGPLVHANNAIELTPTLFLEAFTTRPLGTYWYLHTIFICIFVYSVASFALRSRLTALIVASVILFCITEYLGVMRWCNVLYFVIGCYLRLLAPRLDALIRPSLWLILPIVVIAIVLPEFSREAICGLGLTFLIIGFLMAAYQRISAYRSLHSTADFVAFIGQNSLAVVVFSPMFTIVTKPLAAPMSFEPTYYLWFFVSTAIVITLCLLASRICDLISLSRLLLGHNMYMPLKK